MKKKMFILLSSLLMAVAGHAQFEAGKYYVGASITGFDLNYNKGEKWSIGVGGQLGYLFADSWMVLANMEYNYKNEQSSFSIGPAARYYIQQNGIYLGAGVNYVHLPASFNDFMPHFNVGYAFFLNGKVTLEPEIYYNQSFKNHDYSGVGLRLRFGLFF